MRVLIFQSSLLIGRNFGLSLFLVPKYARRFQHIAIYVLTQIYFTVYFLYTNNDCSLSWQVRLPDKEFRSYALYVAIGYRLYLSAHQFGEGFGV